MMIYYNIQTLEKIPLAFDVVRVWSLSDAILFGKKVEGHKTDVWASTMLAFE